MTTLTTVNTRSVEAASSSPAASPGLFRSYMVLTKARLSALVLLTTAVGYVMAQPAEMDWARLAFTVAGTALAAGCANALNQVMEVARDERMLRTRKRPLPAGDIGLHHATSAAVVMGTAGAALLTVFVSLDAAWLATLTVLIYVMLYTPLKTRSTLNTLVGAVCGALPPVIGWVAAKGDIEMGALVLGAILFVWQLPHFLALAWMYRDDYRRGGYRMLPAIDDDGRMTCNIIVLTSAMLVPLGLMATLLGLAGYWFALGATVLAAWMIALSLRLQQHRSDANARGLFLASITYLPALMLLMVLDRGPVDAAQRATPRIATLVEAGHDRDA